MITQFKAIPVKNEVLLQSNETDYDVVHIIGSKITSQGMISSNFQAVIIRMYYVPKMTALRVNI